MFRNVEGHVYLNPFQYPLSNVDFKVVRYKNNLTFVTMKQEIKCHNIIYVETYVQICKRKGSNLIHKRV